MAQRGGLWDLTPYELDRQPHLLSQDNDAVIRTTGRLLESELQCAICLDVLRKTMTTKECLHRFCDECIRQALRNGNKAEAYLHASSSSGPTFRRDYKDHLPSARNHGRTSCSSPGQAE
ncbi:hypothetical protein RvY_08833-2 [Ramazzottius varieornatus]|uniref:RING-type E3 ubiquitin transferase n=1 Tax=Ramazzottius varieornatus TaxID=947166 RepID=A0A1D1V790_RAMVA|nr:hypothetical protein RvY_08833-2 [Ramazzottius varieornatus]